MIKAWSFLLIALSYFPLTVELQQLPKPTEILPAEILRTELTKAIDAKDWPKEFSYQDKKFSINYTFDKGLTDIIQQKIQRYKPNYVSVVVVDNNNNNILAAIDYDRAHNSFGHKLTFSSTHPAASLFKIITAAELLEKDAVSTNSLLAYRGRTTTLFKNQLATTKSRRVNQQTFGKAFAVSNNVIFAKAALEHLKYENLYNMAQKFGMNEDLFTEINLPKSTIQQTPQEVQELKSNESQMRLAEIASGFNTITSISPVHAALLSSIIMNNGQLIFPKMVDSVYVQDTKPVWPSPMAEQQIKNVMQKDTAEKLRSMMQMTVSDGTARRAFNKHSSNKFLSKIEIGGKTGHFTGGTPEGKRDWFTAYARLKDGAPDDKGVSICVMIIINNHRSYIKSTQLAHEILSEYYKDNIHPKLDTKLAGTNKEQRNNS